MPPHTDDLRIRTIEPLTPPAQLLAMLPCDDEASDTVSASRAALPTAWQWWWARARSTTRRPPSNTPSA